MPVTNSSVSRKTAKKMKMSASASEPAIASSTPATHEPKVNDPQTAQKAAVNIMPSMAMLKTPA